MVSFRDLNHEDDHSSLSSIKEDHSDHSFVSSINFDRFDFAPILADLELIRQNGYMRNLDLIIPLTPHGDSPRARSVLLSGIIPTHSSGNTLLVAPFQTSTKRLQKNCMECTRAHYRCVFLSIDDVNCTRCNKFHLSCQFRYSGMFNIFLY